MATPIDIVQSVYAAFGRGDIPGLLAFVADDIEWTFDGSTGDAFETNWVHVWQLRDGRVARFFGMFDTAAAMRARASTACA
jgi:ketosteroid isomerase-like protein